MGFYEQLNSGVLILDGAMGTLLQAHPDPEGGPPELRNLRNPAVIEEIHRRYIDAGAQMVYTNTFGANRFKLAETGYTVDAVVRAGVAAARRAAAGTATLVALDIGPSGQLLAPAGALSFEEAYDLFAEVVAAGREADLIVIETMTDLYEAKAAVLAAVENSDKPVICSMSFEADGRTFTGCSPAAMALTLGGLGVAALGVNCSCGPAELESVVRELSRWTSLPLLVKPNAGLPDPATGAYDVTPAAFAATSVYGFTVPSLEGGVHMMISSTPATEAGTAFMRTVEGYCARPPGT